MVSAEYLNKIGFATIRREPGDTSDSAMDSLLIDYVEEARSDMILKGVRSDVANNELNNSVRGAICSFVRWKMSFTSKDSVPNLNEYQLQVDELRKNQIMLESEETNGELEG